MNAAAAFVRNRWNKRPQVAIILGSGLSGLAASIHQEAVIPYTEVPQFPRTTALSHTGQLVCGQLCGVPVIAMEGRCHFYEGYSFEEITFPVCTLSELGAELLIVSNASGGLNPGYRTGDIMLIEDHINLLGARTAVGGPSDSLLPVRTTAPSVYDAPLLDLAAETARCGNFTAHRGVYLAVTGPCYETRAEYRAFRRLGGDAVGMSTVPEVLAAAAAGLRVLGLSTITNVAQPAAPQKTEAHQVVDVAAQAEPKLRRIVERVVWSQRTNADKAGHS